MNAITIEQLADKDFVLPKTKQKAKKYINQINISLINYGMDNLIHNPFYICLDKGIEEDNDYMHSICKYINDLYSKAGWIITSSYSYTALRVEINHPKLEIFK